MYRLLRQRRYKVALAQVAANLKSKAQTVVNQGQPDVGYALCGLEDPSKPAAFHGEPWELALITDGLEARSKLDEMLAKTAGVAGGDGNHEPRVSRKQAAEDKKAAAAAQKAKAANGGGAAGE